MVIIMIKKWKESFLFKVLDSCGFALRLGWKISKRRVLAEFLNAVVYNMNWIIIGCLAVWFILDMAGKAVSFEKMMLYVWVITGLSVLM